jgi:hypothetical protein
VVLPYHLMHNSAAALTALSLDRPVLVPHNAVTRALANEPGDGWVHTYRGELTGADIEAAIRAVRSGERGPQPALDARSWQRTTRAHLDAYTRAARIARYARPTPGYSRSTAR